MRIIGNNPAAENAEITAVASGTLPNGQPVIVNADGTVSVVGERGVDQEVGSPVVFESALVTFTSTVYDANTQKVVIAYRDYDNLSYGTAVVGTVSGTSISFGNPVVFESSRSDFISATYDANAQKVVIAYQDYLDSFRGTAIVGTVSGTSISFGSPVVFEVGITQQIATTYDTNAQKVVIAYRDQDNANYGTAIVGNVSGTSISFGSPVVFESAYSLDFSATYDADAQKVVIAYRDFGNSSYGTAIVGTVSGTSISFGSPVVFDSTYVNFLSATYDANAQKVVIAYTDSGIAGYGYAIVGTVSGTSISFGNRVVFRVSSISDISSTYDSSVQKIVIAYAVGTSYGAAIVGTVSGTSINFGTEVVFENANSESISTTYDANAQKVVIAYRDRGILDYGTSVVFQNAYTTTTLTTENFIGMSGGVVETLSQDEATGTATTFTTSEPDSPKSVFDDSTGKLVIAWTEGGVGKAIVGTVSGASISFGTSATWSSTGYMADIVYDSVNEKVVIVFRNSSLYASSVVGTVSGTSISFGTPVVYESSNASRISATFDTANGKVLASRTGSGASAGYVVVGTVSGTSISWGAASATFDNVEDVSLGYDSTSGKCIISAYATGGNGRAYVATISGTSVTVGASTTFASNINNVNGVFHDADANRMVLAYQLGTDNSAKAIIGTVSGDSISFGTEVSVGSAFGTNVIALCHDTHVNKFLYTYKDVNSPYPGKLRVGTVSGDSISFDPAITFESGETSFMNIAFGSTQNTSVISFKDGGDGNKGKSLSYQPAGSYVVRGSVADGDKATIDIGCAISTNQLGLTAGQTYYVQTDGTLGLTAADPSVIAGTAISATEIIVKG